MNKVGIVLLNMGGPKDLESVHPFLYNLFSDPELIQLPRLLKPAQKLIARLVAKKRTPGTISMYEQIGGGSPILDITQGLSSKIENEMKSRGYIVKTTVCMRYTDPDAQNAVESLESFKPEKVVLFSQYPHYAESTTQSSLNDFYNYSSNSALNGVKYLEVDNWGDQPEYLNWWIKEIQKQFKQLTDPEKENVHIIFSAHGLPIRYIKNGEKYPDRVRKAVDRIVEHLGEFNFKWHLSYQSRAGPMEWTKPYTDDKIEEISEDHPSALIMVPIGFVSNHVETLYEIDILYRDLALEKGISSYYRVSVPDDDDDYSVSIADMLVRYLEEN